MKIIAFLGNPGTKYKNNRHNAGFIVGRIIAKDLNISLKKKEFHSICGTGKVGGNESLIILPETYMNNSGLAVNSAMRYYNSGPEDLIVVHDEIELPFGEIRVKTGGGHKGHNGIRSIGRQIGSLEFTRVRIGVGRPLNPEMQVADYLLSDFTSEELNAIKDLYQQVAQTVLSIIN
jgi:PTH1 family peptidyl-tRNA hydrolase